MSGFDLTLQPADENFGGIVTTGNQNFNGKKYFWNSIFVVDGGGIPTVSIANTGITFENLASGVGTINATNVGGIASYELPSSSGTFALSVNGNFADTAGEISLTATSVGAEPALGNPPVSGYVLSSTTAGVRSWIAPAGAGSGITRSINNIAVNTTALAVASTDYVYNVTGTTTLNGPAYYNNTASASNEIVNYGLLTAFSQTNDHGT